MRLLLSSPFTRQKSRLLVLALLVSGICLSACDKEARQKSANGGASPTKELAPSALKEGELPQETPTDQETASAINGFKNAEEEDLSPPVFDETASKEFVAAFSQLNQWVSAKKGKVHAALVDLQSDKWLLRSRSTEAVNPASNAKLVTAAAALELLGPAHSFQTEIFGRIEKNGSCERLVVRGGGAPDLTTADFWRLIRVAKGKGLRQVQNIIVDQTRFTDDYVPPAFAQQPKEWAPFRAPISALALNRNSISLNIVSTEVGEDARFWYDPPGLVYEKGRVKTGKKGGGDRVSWSLDPSKNVAHMNSLIGGSLATGSGRRRYARRLEDPRLAPGHALAALLKESNIVVEGTVSAGARHKEPRLALWSSEPVAELVRAMGKKSDNFTAEMLFVALSAAEKGAQEAQGWSSERGARVIRRWLSEKKISLEGIVIKNGSGLFDANRLSAELLTTLLAAMEDNPRVYQEFVSQLAIGATDGTLKKRMRKGKLGGRIRAKTGTLRHVDALSGYIQRPGGRSPAAFSVIVVGPRVSHSAVRARVDKLILKWAELLQ